MEVVKIGTTELTRQEAEEIYENNKYVCNYGGIYQVHYSAAQNRFYGSKVIDCKGYANRGRFFIQTGEQINQVLGAYILN